MNSFIRISYTNNPCYRLKHITGMYAKDSTIPDPHHTLNIILVYFVSGSGNVKIEGKQYNLSGGEIIAFTPAELYKLTVDDGQYHERIAITTNEIWMKNFLNDTHSAFMPFYKKQKAEGNVISEQTVSKYGLDVKFREMIELAQNNDGLNSIIATCKVVEILALIGKIIDTETSQNKERKNPIIQNALLYINKHLREDINISDVATKLNINKSYLSHLFKEYVGMSVMNYVILRRIYLFNHLIQSNDSIEKTAYEVGFRNYSNFYRLYKKHMQMTPLEFKKTNENI